MPSNVNVCYADSSRKSSVSRRPATWNQEITSKVCSGDGQAVRSSACDRAVQEGKDGILAVFFLPRQTRDGSCSWKCYCACDQTIYKKHQSPKDSQAVRSNYPSPFFQWTHVCREANSKNDHAQADGTLQPDQHHQRFSRISKHGVQCLGA